MSDPAVEAALRAWIKPRGAWARPHFDPTNRLELALTDAAREALKPIRELHRRYATNDPRSPYDVVCNHCLGPKQWPCLTARLVYSDEELS